MVFICRHTNKQTNVDKTTFSAIVLIKIYIYQFLFICEFSSVAELCIYFSFVLNAILKNKYANQITKYK